MPVLSDVTLCCIDTANHRLAAASLSHANALMGFAKTVFITDRDDCVEPGWEFHRIRPLAGIQDYNRFLLKGLVHHIDTPFVLIVQYDGLVAQPEMWSDEFLQYDYIGAPWPHHPHTPVGNGGFSLRSRKLLEALTDDQISLKTGHPEDLVICAVYGTYLEMQHGIRFAPVPVAERFAYEYGDEKPAFGFHGLHLLDKVYSGAEKTAFLMDNLQPYVFRKTDIFALATRYATSGRHTEAGLTFKALARHMTCEEANRIAMQLGGSPQWGETIWKRYVLQ